MDGDPGARGPGYYDEGGVWVSTRTPKRRSGGGRWDDSDGTRHTVNPTDDPRVPGGYYHSVGHGDGTHDTSVYDADGSLAEVRRIVSFTIARAKTRS